MNWTGVVLAGGRSSRMGRDKALLDWHGQPLIQHMRKLLEIAGAERVVISGDYPSYGAVPDRTPELGPLGGLISIATALRAETTLLIVPVDMPLLSTPLLQGLIAAPAAASVRYADHVLPLRLRWDAYARRTLRQLGDAERSGRSLRALHIALAGIELAPPPGSEAEFANGNTPEDWHRLCSSASSLR